MALSKTTQDHEEIRRWAEARGARPAEVGGTDRKGQTGILRLEFPGAPHANDSKLKEISWDEFFEKFDSSGLALTYQDVTADGEQSNFNKLVYPEDSKDKSTGSGSRRSAGKSRSNGGESVDDQDQFEDAAVDQPGDIDADSGDEDDDEYIHDTGDDTEEQDETGTGNEKAASGRDLETATRSAGSKSSGASSAKKSASSKSASGKSDAPRTSSKASAKKSTTGSARGRH